MVLSFLFSLYFSVIYLSFSLVLLYILFFNLSLVNTNYFLFYFSLAY